MTPDGGPSPLTKGLDARVWLGVALVWLLACLEVSWLLPGGRSDDAEIMLHTQAFAWGYRLRNPPLFDWLAWAGMQLAGPSPVVVFALRLGCLALTVGLLWQLARRCGLTPVAALAAALAPLWVLQFFYYALVDLTHTVLAAVFYVATAAAAAWAARRPDAMRMAVLGLTVGLGLLTKYVYVLFALAAVVACARVPSYRPLLQPTRLAVALAVALMVGAPHLAWVLQHDGQSLQAQQHESLQTAAGWSLPHALAGLGAWAGYSLAVTLPGLLVLALSLGRHAGLMLPVVTPGWSRSHAAGPARPTPLTDDARWLAWTLGGTLLAVAAVVGGLGAARVRPHHLIFLVLAPLAGLMAARGLRLKQDEALSPALQAGLRRFVLLSLAWVALNLTAFGWDALRTARRCELCGPYIDYRALAGALRLRGLEGGTLYYASRHRLLNLPMLRSHVELSLVRLDAPATESPGPRRADRPCAVIWMPRHDTWLADTSLIARLPPSLAQAVQNVDPEIIETRLRTVSRSGQPLALVSAACPDSSVSSARR